MLNTSRQDAYYIVIIWYVWKAKLQADCPVVHTAAIQLCGLRNL